MLAPGLFCLGSEPFYKAQTFTHSYLCCQTNELANHDWHPVDVPMFYVHLLCYVCISHVLLLYLYVHPHVVHVLFGLARAVQVHRM